MGWDRVGTLADVSESVEATTPPTLIDHVLPCHGDCPPGPRASDSTAFPLLVGKLQLLLTERRGALELVARC